jgi:Ca2+-binding RTX toxin-like protein
MADFASILGGNPADTLPGDEVGRNQDAYYRIDAADVFVDRFDSSGDSVVDAARNSSGVRIELGSGTDTVYGGIGDDTVWAGAGDDILRGGGGSNTISGAAGDDSLESGSGADSLLGGSGADTVLAGAGNDYVSGGAGADSLRGDGGDDSILGGSGDDFLHGQAGADELMGGSGADLLMGGAGDDTLFGGTGRDVFAFDNGFGQDVISDFGPGDRINLAADLNGTGIRTAQDLLTAEGVSITGGTTTAGTKFTLITIGADTIRLDKVDQVDFISQIGTWVKVG